MKIKLSELNPNPFKKYINGGRFDKETLQKIMANVDKLKDMGALPVFKKNKKYYLVAGHHRVEVFKQKFGEQYEIEVTLHDYNTDQIIRGMVIENLTQRMNKFREEGENLLLVRDYLRDNNILLDENGTIHSLGERVVNREQGGGKQPELGSVTQLCLWLDNNTGDVMKHTKIYGILSVFDNLAPDLLETVEKASHAIGEKEEEILGVKDAIRLASFDNHEEQRDLAKSLLNSREQHGNLKQKNLTAYKKAPESVKRKVREQLIDIADVEDEIFIYEQEQAKDTKLLFTASFEDQLEDFDYTVIQLEKHIDTFKRVFNEKNFQIKYEKLLPHQKEKLGIAFLNLKNRIKKCSDEIDLFVSYLPNRKLLEVKNEKNDS